MGTQFTFVELCWFGVDTGPEFFAGMAALQVWWHGMGLNDIIDPGNSNCGGGGATVDHDDDGETVTAPRPKFSIKTVSGAIATDVAKGYTETLTAYLGGA